MELLAPNRQELVVQSLGSLAVFLLLLNRHTAWPTSTAVASGHFALAAIFARLFGAMDIPWLGPGLVVAFVLLITLRGRRRAAEKPVHRRFRMPRLERYRGEISRQHHDLEV